MGYVNINWSVKSIKEEKNLIRYIIDAVGGFSCTYRDIKVTREGIIRLKKRVNRLIEKYIKTDYRVEIPLLEKDENDDDWHRACLKRRVDFELIKNE